MGKRPDDNARLMAGAPLDPLDDLEEVRPEAAPRLRRAGALLAEVFPRLERRARGEERPIPLPWRHVAPQFGGGLWPGLHTLVGGAGAGKSQFALQVAIHAARLGVPALYIALELGEVDLAARLIGLETRRKWSRFYLGQEKPEDLAAARREANLDELPLYLEVGNPGAWPQGALGSLAAALRRAHPEAKDEHGRALRGSAPFLVVLDFLPIVGDAEDSFVRELRETIGKAAYEGRRVAMELDAAVLLVSSTARANYARTSGATLTEAGLGYDEQGFGVIKNPDALIGLGKESGDIEFSGDTVTVLVRWPELLPEDLYARERRASILVATAKQRPGPASWSELRFDGSRFDEPKDGGHALREALQARADGIPAGGLGKPARKSARPLGEDAY